MVQRKTNKTCLKAKTQSKDCNESNIVALRVGKLLSYEEYLHESFSFFTLLGVPEHERDPADSDEAQDILLDASDIPSTQKESVKRRKPQRVSTAQEKSSSNICR